MKQRWVWALIGANVMALIGCGGSSGSTASTAGLEGVVAVGAPVPNAEVVIKDASGATQTATADAEGHYVFSDISALKVPYILQATGTVGGSAVVLHSVLDKTSITDGSTQVVNVTPATTAIAAQTLLKDPAVAFSEVKTGAPLTIDSDKLTAAKERLRAALADVLAALGQTDVSKVDLITTKFTANNTGLDKLFDLVSVQTSATATSRDIVVTEKKDGGSSVTFGTDIEASAVSKLSKPGSEVDLDLSSIKNFVSQFNIQVKTADGIKSEVMKDFFDDAFLDNGMSKADLIDDLANNAVGMIQMSGLLINGCQAATTATRAYCNTHITMTQLSDNSVETMPMKFVLGVDKKWRAYGNQSKFDFEIKPVVMWDATVTTSNSSSSISAENRKMGINFWFTGRVKGVLTYQSAELYSSNDNGANWSKVVTLRTAQGSSCGSNMNWLPIDGGDSNNCSNFIEIANQGATDANSAQKSGTRKLKIIAYPNRDLSGTSAVFETYANKSLFTTDTATQAITDNSSSITLSELNSNSVSFSAGTAILESVAAGILPKNAITGGSLPWTNWGNPATVKTLSGKVTVGQALQRCEADAGSDTAKKAACSTTYADGALIKRIHLSARDNQGRGIWKTWHVPNY